MQSDISIIIPAHNRQKMLVEAIASCQLAGTGLALQVIVIDDASPEDIGTAVSRLGVRYERLPRNSGSSVARNRGLALSEGRYVKFLDSDDVLVVGALQREYECATRTGADIVVAGWIETALDADQRETVLAKRQPPMFSSIPDDLLAGRAVPTSAALYRGSLARAVAWDSGLAKLNDWDFFVMAAMRSTNIASVDGASYRWRQHSGERITSSTSFVGNAVEFYAILGKLQAVLEANGEFTPARRSRMAQYLYKELRGMYRFDRARGRQILARLLDLDPHFRPRDEERSALLRSLYALLPAEWVLSGYGIARRLMDRFA